MPVLGILLPQSLRQTTWFAILAALVAIKTAMYVTLAVAKILPKFYARDWFHGCNRRAETRNIDPDAPI